MSSESPIADEVEPGEISGEAHVGLFGRLWSRFRSRRPAESAQQDTSHIASDEPVKPREDKFEEMDMELGEIADVKDDDDLLDHIFASTKGDKLPPMRGSDPVAKEEDGWWNKKKEEDGDDFLDLIFASKREVPAHAPPLPPPDAPLEPPDEDLNDNDPLDAIFAKPAQKKSRDRDAKKNEDDESFGDFFHRPANRNPQQQSKKEKGGQRGEGAMPSMPSSAPRRQHAAGDEDVKSKTEFSAGLSAIFATATRKAPGSRISGAGSKFSKPPDSTASSQQDDFYEEDEDDEDDGEYCEAPDFIGFALGIARKATGAGDDGKSSIAGSDIFGKSRDRDLDDDSDISVSSAVDSLADLEPSEMKDLFHPPL